MILLLFTPSDGVVVPPAPSTGSGKGRLGRRSRTIPPPPDFGEEEAILTALLLSHD